MSTKNIDNEKLEVLDFNFQFIYILNSTLLFYIIDRIFHQYFYFIEIFGISPKFIELFSVFSLTAIISVILSIPLTILFTKIINKKFLKIINLIKNDWKFYFLNISFKIPKTSSCSFSFKTDNLFFNFLSMDCRIKFGNDGFIFQAALKDVSHLPGQVRRMR